MPYYSTKGKFGAGKSNPNYGGTRSTASPTSSVFERPDWMTYSGHAGQGPAGPRGPGHPMYDEKNPGYGWREITNPADIAAGIRRYIDANGVVRTIRSGGSHYGGGGGGRGRGFGAGYGAHQGKDPYWWLQGFDRKAGEAPSPFEVTAFTGSSYMAPELAIPEAGVDTRAVVGSMRHFLDEEMSGEMADAARRAGAAGMLDSSTYGKALGEAERSRDRDLASLYYQYDYDAAQADAQRKLQSRLQTQQLMHQAELDRLAREYDAWYAQNQFGLSSHDMDLEQWALENNIDLDWFSALAGLFGPGTELDWNPSDIY
jgi:hypothetical protein